MIDDIVKKMLQLMYYTACIRRALSAVILLSLISILSLVVIHQAQAGPLDWQGVDPRLQAFSAPDDYGIHDVAHALKDDHFPTAREQVLELSNDEADTGSSASDDTDEEEPQFDSFWAWLWDYLYNGASITLGVGTRQAELGVTRKSDDDYGKIVQRDEEAYFISYSTRTTFMGTTRLAYTFMLNYSTFNLDKQEIGKDNFVALGTQVKGDMAYVVPAVFYQWGEDRYPGTYARIGIGVGLGVTRYRGDIQLFPSGDIVSLSDRTYDLNFAYGAFAEARFRHIGIKISAAGPTFEDDLYKYNVSDIAISLGYQFFFP